VRRTEVIPDENIEPPLREGQIVVFLKQEEPLPIEERIARDTGLKYVGNDGDCLIYQGDPKNVNKGLEQLAAHPSVEGAEERSHLYTRAVNHAKNIRLLVENAESIAGTKGNKREEYMKAMREIVAYIDSLDL
jgi:hypothetical protein